MVNDKPRDIRAYTKGLKDKHNVEISEVTGSHYNSVTYKIKRDFEQSDFWKQVISNLRTYDEDYLATTGYHLFDQETKEVFVKTYASFFEKTYRKNIVENPNWPDAPNEGWILPNNWYSRINDVIRTLFVVKYLDGTRFLAGKVGALCRQVGLEFRMSYEAREDGYYAVHLYARQNFEVPRLTWDTERINVSIEMQVTTQLQEVIRKMLHKYYEGRRAGKRDGIRWQWDYQSEEFAANYLGHILHYVEGMIMEIIEKQREKIP